MAAGRVAIENMSARLFGETRQQKPPYMHSEAILPTVWDVLEGVGSVLEGNEVYKWKDVLLYVAPSDP